MSTATETLHTETPATGADKYARRFERQRIEVLLRAQTPIAQMEKNVGNMGIIMRKKVCQNDGTFERVPYVTANAMRHQMREASTYALLEAAGMIDNPNLSESAVRLLFSGGTLTGKGDASKVNLDTYRRLAEIVPPLALFGGCADNRLIPGNLRVEDAQLVCWETLTSIPPWVVAWMSEKGRQLASCRDHVEKTQRVRMDPSLSPQKRALMTAGERAAVETRLLASGAAHDAADHRAAEETKSTMMPHSFESICEGSLLSWAVEADCYTPLEVDTFYTALGAFLLRARVGGRSGTSYGRLEWVAGQRVHLRASHDLSGVTLTDIAGRPGELFRAHVAERRDEIVKFLSEVAA